MDIPGIRGPSGLPPDKGPGSSRKTRADRAGDAAQEPKDSVFISEDSSRQARNVEVLAGQLRSGDGDRDVHLEAVRARLDSGELDRPEIFRQTAYKILRSFMGE